MAIPMTTETSRDKAFEVLRSFETAMLVTHAPSGPLDCRPMQIADVDPDGSVWFLTSGEGDAALHVKKHPEVLLVMADEHRRYLSIFGRARVVTDRDRIREIWKEPYRVWFPNGPDDVDAVLLAVTADYAEYWDLTGSRRWKYLFEAAKTDASGTRRSVDEPDQHGRTRF